MGPDGDARLSLRGRWLAILAATVLLQLSFWPAVTAAADRSGDSGGDLAIGLALVPFVLGVLAFASRHPRAPGAVLKGMGLFALVGGPVMLLDVALGMVAGYAAGGAVALRPTTPSSSTLRWAAAGAAVGYVLLLLLLHTGFALMSAAVLPFAIHGLVDQAVEGRSSAGAGQPAG